MYFSLRNRSQRFNKAAINRALKVCVLALSLTIQPTSQAQNEPTTQARAEFTWKDRSGNVCGLSDLQEILHQHRIWFRSEGKSGKQADLRDANLTGTVLDHALLREADLRGAILEDAHLEGVNLIGAHLEDAKLVGAHLSGAILMHAQLSGAVMGGADISRANLVGTDLDRTWLYGTDLDGAIFEPESLPDIRGISWAKNLELLTYQDNPSAIVQLRKQFVDNGFREQERKATYVLKRRETELSCERCRSQDLLRGENRAILWSSDSTVANCGSFVLNKVFFDWTCQYGMSPGRALSLGVLFWLICSLLYLGFLHTHGEAGLYRVYGSGIRDDAKAPQVERIALPKNRWSKKSRSVFQRVRDELLLLRTAIFFSLMSAFNIGFRDINFGRWLRLLTRQEFDIKAVGWARVVAGWQSLISVYLIALWVLTYFGRPFG